VSYLDDSLKGATLVFSTKTFEEKINLELDHFGAAHTVDDVIIWITVFEKIEFYY
jgi:hypothetical protein